MRRAALGLFAALLAAAHWVGGCAEAGPPAPPGTEAWVSVQAARIAVEIADTREEQSLGLGQRDELAWGRGMLFVYPEPGFPGFWMKDMRFDIDIVWIRDGHVVGIQHQVRHLPTGPGPIYRPPELTDTVLEVPAGTAAAHGWRRGDRVRVERLQPR
ncbi:MAG: DUF192 domain-containing protein [Proteobacteria bacterium]|nr:DUF192 domain-containing protein [Pseudomonadota bacterium]